MGRGPTPWGVCTVLAGALQTQGSTRHIHARPGWVLLELGAQQRRIRSGLCSQEFYNLSGEVRDKGNNQPAHALCWDEKSLETVETGWKGWRWQQVAGLRLHGHTFVPKSWLSVGHHLLKACREGCLSGEKPPSYETEPPLSAGIPFAVILLYQDSQKVSWWWDLTTVHWLFAGIVCCYLRSKRHNLCSELRAWIWSWFVFLVRLCWGAH